MKVSDSGMPDEAYWNTLFDIPRIVDWLNLESVTDPIVEFGCGYGTFTLPIAKGIQNIVYAFDMEASMIETAEKKARDGGIQNVRFNLRDILEQKTGLEANIAGMVLLFNILHFNERRIMLEEACRILKPFGTVAIIHWRKDIQTPRGPGLELRPDQRTILDSVQGLGLSFDGNSRILEPYHWGIQLIKKSNQ